MKLLSAAQIKEWDKYTIQNEPISSIDLMERAARACFNWIERNINAKSFFIFCGYGNNGGDGLAIARLLSKLDVQLKVFILNDGGSYSHDFNINLDRLKEILTLSVIRLNADTPLPSIPESTIIIDALFGTGLNRAIEGFNQKLVKHINGTPNKVIAIDIPSGMFCDSSSKNFETVKADYTLTFQCLKKSFLMAENESTFGKIELLNIGLLPSFLDTIKTEYELIDKNMLQAFYKPRKAFAHKGKFGHALIMAGSIGKMGAAVLCIKSCLRSGAGLVTAHIPKKGIDIIQTTAPEAMCIPDINDEIVTHADYDLNNYDVVGIGPGIQQKKETADFLLNILNNYKKPMVLDADALNILSGNKDWLKLLPEYSILTPHPKEFARLFGEHEQDFSKAEAALRIAKELRIIILLKGHYSFIATPWGKGYFNTTGNAGMAKGGSGDVLTGIITGLLAQGYTPEEATIMGVFIHGIAGDRAAEKYGMDAMIAGDLIEEMKSPFSQNHFR